MLELFKPLLMVKNKNNPVIFDEFGLKYSDEDKKYIKNITLKRQIENNHPFIIFYDSNEECYYYLKARSVMGWDIIENKSVPRKKYPNEIIITESFDEGLFNNDSYVDCSQIFKCDKQLLESLIDINHEYYLKTNVLCDTDIENILWKVNDSCNEVPPNLSIVEVKIDDNGNSYGESIYLLDQKIQMICDEINSKNYDLSQEGKNMLKDMNSHPNKDYHHQMERYKTGIDFVKMFQKEYFNQEYQNTDYNQKYYQPFGINNSKSKDKER